MIFQAQELLNFHTPYTFELLLNRIKFIIMGGLIISLFLGAVAGWLGSEIYKGHGLGLPGNIIVGIIGGVIGYWLLGKLGVSFGGGIFGYIITAAIGSIVLLFLINLISGRRS